jgi:hypothetical protein
MAAPRAIALAMPMAEPVTLVRTSPLSYRPTEPGLAQKSSLKHGTSEIGASVLGCSDFIEDFAHLFRPCSAVVGQHQSHGRFLGGGRDDRVRGRDARARLGLGPGMNAVQGVLLAVSIVVFIYLAIAMFKPEWF